MQSEPCKSPLKCVKNVKSLHSLLSLKYPTVTFLPFNLHISNYQRFIKTIIESEVIIYEHHVLFNKDKTTIIAYRAKETNYIIPECVTKIGACAFRECESLVSIDIHDGMTTIERGAFWDCKSLTSINIPNSVTTIEKGAFQHCDKIPTEIKSDIIQRFGKEVFDS